jgi:glycosyltransferase involved in cell wall biosynthesis
MHSCEETVTVPVAVDALVGCSKFVVDFYRNTQPLLRAKNYFCIYNGVDIDKFKPFWEVSYLRRSVREKFGVREDEFVVLFVGRLIREKGIEDFLKSALTLKEKKNIKFIVVGEIPKGDVRNERVMYVKEILRTVSSIKDKITFTDVIPPSKVHLLYLLGDIVVVPSIWEEAFSMAAIEAMATGLPVIASRKGGLREYIDDALNGFFVDENNRGKHIAERIEALIIDENIRRRVGEAARKTVEERFSWERISTDLEGVYSTILGKS